MKEAIACIDYGTSSVKACLVDPYSGEIISSHSEKYHVVSPEPGFIELPPDILWDYSQKCVKVVFDKLMEDKLYHVIAFSFCFFGDNVMPCDANGNPLNNLIVFFDPRGKEEIGLLNNHFPENWVIDTVGSPFTPQSVPSKLLWFKKNRNDLFHNIKKIYTIQSYTMKRLNVEDANDYSAGCRLMMLDINTYTWSKEILDYLGINESMFGQAKPSTTIVGEIDSFGNYKLPYKIPVVLGAHDVACGILGTGITSRMPGTIANISGTLDMYAQSDFTGKNKGLRTSGCLDGISNIMAAFPSGILIDWFMRTIHGDTTPESFQHYWQESRLDGSNRVKATPFFFTGNGRFTDMGLDCSREDLFTAIIESTVFEARKLVEGFNSDFGIKTDTIHIGGGPSQSDKYNQHKANVTGITTKSLKVKQVSVLGTAIIGAVAMGLYGSLETAMEALIKIDKEYKPNAELHAVYRKKFEEYQRINGW